MILSMSIFSYSKDEDEVVLDIDAKNELTYDGQTGPLNYGEMDDYGYDGSHTNYEFHLYHIISETDLVVPTYLFVDLFSPNEDGFKGGTFKVSGSGMDYKLEFDLVREDGKSLKGSYGGTFQPLNRVNAASRYQTVDLLNKLSIPKPLK